MKKLVLLTTLTLGLFYAAQSPALAQEQPTQQPSAEEAENLHGLHPGIGLVQGRGLGHDAADFAQRLQNTNRRNPKWGPSPP